MSRQLTCDELGKQRHASGLSFLRGTQLQRLSTSAPASTHDWLQTWLQQQRRSKHGVGCFCALPGCASTTLISPIYRTHCIQSTYLLRTSARQNHSLLIAVVSEIERTAECGGGEGCEKEERGGKKKCSTEMCETPLQRSHYELSCYST